MIQVVPFETDDDNEKYKAVMQSINDFLGELKLDVPGIGKQLHQVWCGEVFKNGTKNSVVNSLYQSVLKYATELGIVTDTSIAASYLFTSNLKELSGALLHKTVFAFRLAYILEIERAIGDK